MLQVESWISSLGVLGLVILIPLVLFLIVNFISMESDSHRDKLQPFECGFEAFSSSRISFSIKFYLVVIIFLIFDVEIALVLPLPLIPLWVCKKTWFVINISIFSILILGLGLEWSQGSLSWVD